ncbi:hypothetical protein BOX15_Mlig000758g2 [Macrostomum lignano]|uniref:TASOR pseudo-PARP domain-containing protein n=2 Tax=Macrostomum lignano TaxID=282301 RepID=A0A267GDX0_9PLAT|nr:hypothetical protein BOX15_Mlig000758g2 [Macrostomum lignano]
MDKYSSRRVIREAVNLGSDYATQIFRGFVDSFLNPPSATLDQWRLVKLEMLENGYFEEEFSERRAEFSRQGLAQDELSTHYGFLAAASEELVDLTLREGLKVRFCPINSLGYCISGVHLCVHGDVCLQEAALETGDDGEQIVLVAFKFMFGRTRRVTPVTPKDMAIIAPSPGFNCHIPDVRPGRTDSLSDQYLRSLAYLYEFENSFYHPVPRPRQCSPLAALYLRRRRGSGVPPKPPQFLPTASRFPSAAVTASLASSLSSRPPSIPSMPPPAVMMSMSGLISAASTQAQTAAVMSQQPMLRLAPDVASAVGSVLSELRYASSTTASAQRQQQQPPPKLDGIRGFLKNASGSAAAASGNASGSSTSNNNKVQPLMQQQTSAPIAASSTPLLAVRQASKQSQQQQPPPPLAEPPRRNAFLTAGAAASSAAATTATVGATSAASSAGANRFHPYARLYTAAASSVSNNGSSNQQSASTVGRKSGFGVGQR